MTIPMAELLTAMLVFLRAVAFFVAAPIFSWRLVFVQLRIGLAILLAFIFAPLVEPFGMPGSWFVLALSAAEAVICGLIMGLSMRLLMAAIEVAGQLIATEMGLAMSAQFDPSQGKQETVPARILNMLSMFLFFAGGYHHEVIAALYHSFTLRPLTSAGLFSFDGAPVIQASSQLFVLGVQMAAPIIALNFLVNLCFAVLGKAVPKMNVFMTSFAVRILASMAVLAGVVGLFAEYILGIHNNLADIGLQSLQP